MRRKNTFYKATTLAMTSVLALGAPVIAHAENTEGTNLSDEGYPEINPQIAALENQELEIWLPADQGQDPNFQTVKEKFEESYPNITINYNTSIPWEEMPSKVKLAVNSGAAPDLALHHSFVAGAQGFAEPLDDLWEKWGAEDEFMESSLQDCTWNNVKYGVPFNITSVCLLYNEDMYKEAGITEAPTTLEELREVSKKLTDSSKGQYGFTCYANPWGLFGVVAAEGYNLIDENNNPTINDKGVVDTLQTYIDIATVDSSSIIPPAQESQAETATAMYGSGRAAQILTGAWDIAALKNQYPDVFAKTKVAPMPGNGHSGVAGGGSFFIPLGAQHKEAAFELMKWLTSDAFIIPFSHSFGQFPCKESQLSSFSDEMLDPFLEALPNAKPYVFEAFPESADAFEQAIRAGFDGGDFAAMLDSAQQIAEDEFQEVLN